MTDASNYGALSEGLKFYVAAMRRFIARTLRERHGDSDDWFEKQVLATLPRYLRNPLRQRWLTHQRQQAADDQEGPEQLLDPSHFRHIINAHWDNTYEAIFGERVALYWIGEVAYWRNVWAHAADKADVEAERILDTCQRVLQRFDLRLPIRSDLCGRESRPHRASLTATQLPTDRQRLLLMPGRKRAPARQNYGRFGYGLTLPQQLPGIGRSTWPTKSCKN